jgi:hypothetical protein
MKKIARIFIAALAALAVFFFLLYKNEILFTLALIEIKGLKIITENKDYCKKKIDEHTLIEKCGSTGKTVNTVLLPGFSPQGASHPTLIRFASALIFSGLSERVFILEIPSLSKTPEWNPEKTEEEISQSFEFLKKEWQLEEKKFSVYSVCGSSSAYMKVLAEGKVSTPSKIIFYTPYYSYKSLLLSVPTDKSDSHIQAIIYYNAKHGISLEEKKRITDYFLDSKPGDDSGNAKKYLGEQLFQKIQTFRATEGIFKGRKQFETILPKGLDIEINIITSHSDYMPYSEAETLKSELQKNGNAYAFIFYTDLNHANTVNFSILDLVRTLITFMNYVKP